MPRSINPHPVINNPYPTDRVLKGRSAKELRARIEDPRVTIGRGTNGDPKFVLYSADARVVIGNYCSLAGNSVILGGGEHDYTRVTTFSLHWFDGTDPEAETGDSATTIFKDSRTKGTTTIGSDVWVGYGALLLSGVTIGHGAVVGAGAVVASRVPDYAVVIGNPARVLKYRFDPDSIAQLLRLRWWDWNQAAIDRWKPYLVGGVGKFLDAVGRLSDDELAGYYSRDPQDDELLSDRVVQSRTETRLVKQLIPPIVLSAARWLKRRIAGG